jgi:hypothetical protein
LSHETLSRVFRYLNRSTLNEIVNYVSKVWRGAAKCVLYFQPCLIQHLRLNDQGGIEINITPTLASVSDLMSDLTFDLRTLFKILISFIIEKRFSGFQKKIVDAGKIILRLNPTKFIRDVPRGSRLADVFQCESSITLNVMRSDTSRFDEEYLPEVVRHQLVCDSLLLQNANVSAFQEVGAEMAQSLVDNFAEQKHIFGAWKFTNQRRSSHGQFLMLPNDMEILRVERIKIDSTVHSLAVTVRYPGI